MIKKDVEIEQINKRKEIIIKVIYINKIFIHI